MNTKAQHTQGPTITWGDGKTRSVRAVRCKMQKLLKIFSAYHTPAAQTSKAIVLRSIRRIKNAPGRYAKRTAKLDAIAKARGSA